MVFAGGKELLSTVYRRALGRDLRMSIFTADLFSTGHDADNRAAVRSVGSGDLDLAGIDVYAGRNIVDKVTKGARMHP
jgi:hypothetical protein